MPYQWRFDVVWEALPFMLQGLGMTVLLTVISMALSLALGLLVSLARLSKSRLATVPAKAYTELEREGVLSTRPGRGVFVAEPRGELTKKARRERLMIVLDGFLTEAVHLGFSADEVVELTRARTAKFQWADAESTTG